jgi:hypothetical protein
MDNAYALCHFNGSPIPHLHGNDWIFLESGSADSRGTGGAWYYKGDREAALVELAKRKAYWAKAQNAYYSQQWV